MDQESLTTNLNGLEKEDNDVAQRPNSRLKDEIRTIKLENHELRTDLRKRDEQMSILKSD